MSSRERHDQLPLGDARPAGTVASPSAPHRERERQAPRALELVAAKISAASTSMAIGRALYNALMKT